MRLLIEQKRDSSLVRKKFVPWFQNFVNSHNENLAIGPVDLVTKYYKTQVREQLKPYRAHLIETYGGWVLDFDDEADATFFIMKWS